MYEVSEQRGYIKFKFSGRISAEEMQQWLDEMRVAMTQPNAPELVFVDMREMTVLAKEAVEIMAMGQRAAKASGMKRSVVILKSTTVQMQFERLAKTTGIFEKERYISADTNPKWEEAGEAWILHSTEPA